MSCVCSHRDRRQEYIGEVLTLDEWQEWFDCYCARPPQATRKAREHACTSECAFFQHRNLWVCLENGHAHLCNELACDRLVVTDEHQVCTLTGHTYTLELAIEYERGGGRSNEQVMATNATNARTLARPEGRRPPRGKRGGLDGLSCNEPIAATLPELLAVAHEQEWPDVRNQVRRLVTTDTADAVVNSLAHHILDTYHRIVRTRAWSTQTAKARTAYSLERHTLTHLYAMHGRTCDEMLHGRVAVRAWPPDAHLVPLDQQPTHRVSFQVRKESRETTSRFMALMYVTIEEEEAK